MALPIQNKVAETPIVLYVEKAVLLDQRAIKSAKPGKDGLGHPMLDIKFTQSGAKQFAVITRQNINKQIAIIMDGKVCSAPVIRSEILGGSAQISGSFSEQEVKELARKINEAVTMK